YMEVSRDQNVKAVVLRVNSPGGGVAHSDQIYSLVKKLREVGGKKVVASMGGIAASGGYYVCAPADAIVAEPTTITGSIGVIMGWMVVKGTLDRIGMETVMLKSSNARGWKDEISPFKQPDERQKRHLRKILDTMQARFEKVVKEGRGQRLKTNRVSYTVRTGQGEEAREVKITETEPLNGKVYMPDEALAFGLIDKIGYQEVAIDRAADLARLTNPNVVVYRRAKGLLVELLEAKSASTVRLDASLLDRLQTPRILM
ncbi:unnamed protein product, partial [marine sediment metagenome]